MRGQSLKSMVETNGLRWTVERLTEALELGRSRDPVVRKDGLRSEDFSIRELAESFMGRSWVQRLNPATDRFSHMSLQEAGGGEGVDVSAFSNITGQILFNRILEGWDLAKMLGDELVETIKTEFDGEKLPWISQPLTEGAEVHPGMPYPEAGLAEEYITTPTTRKFGAILSVTKEAIFFDRTAQLLRKGNNLGTQLRYNKERRILNTFLGAASAPQFTWKGVTFAPYQAAGTYWSNTLSSLPLVDWTTIETVEIMATRILDPDLLNVGINTPIEIDLDTIIVSPFKQHTAERIVSATEIRSSNLSPAPEQMTISSTPLRPYTVKTSKILYRQLIDVGGYTSTQAQDFWWMIDSKRRPLAYMENWPLRLLQAPPLATAEFERDIVFRIRADERGTPAWIDPRYAMLLRNT